MIYKRLDEVLNYPHPLMLGLESSHAVECMIKGYYVALNFNGHKIEGDNLAFLGFPDFISNYYNLNSLKWGKIIQLFSESNAHSLKLLKEFYINFNQEKFIPNECYLNKILSPFESINEFNKLIEKATTLIDGYGFDSIIELDNFLTGYSLACYDLKELNYNVDYAFFDFWDNHQKFADFIGIELGISSFTDKSNYRKIIMGYYYPMSETLNHFWELFNKFCKIKTIIK